jgi:hypothetical protein
MSNLYIINGPDKQIGYTLEGLKTAMKYFAENIFSDWYNEYYKCRSLLSSWDDAKYNSAYPTGTGGIKYLKNKNQLIHNTAIMDFYHNRVNRNDSSPIDENYNHLKYMCDKFQNWQKDNNCNWDDTAFQVFYNSSNALNVASQIMSGQYVNAGKTTIDALANALDLQRLHRTFIWLNDFLRNFTDNQDAIKTMFYSPNDTDKTFPPSLAKYPQSGTSGKANLPDEFGNLSTSGSGSGSGKAPAPPKEPAPAPTKQENAGALLGLGGLLLLTKLI